MNENTECLIKLRANFLGLSLQDWGPVFFNHIATVDNRLAWTLQYWTNITDVQTAQELAGRVKTMVENLFQYAQVEAKVQVNK